MMEIGNHYLANTTVITSASKRHQYMLKLVDKKYDEKQDLANDLHTNTKGYR